MLLLLLLRAGIAKAGGIQTAIPINGGRHPARQVWGLLLLVLPAVCC
jgi:hypothetical protein